MHGLVSSKLGCVCFLGGGPNNEDYRILGSALGFLLFWEATMCIITYARFRVGFGCVVPGEGGRTEVYMGTYRVCAEKGYMRRRYFVGVSTICGVSVWDVLFHTH